MKKLFVLFFFFFALSCQSKSYDKKHYESSSYENMEEPTPAPRKNKKSADNIPLQQRKVIKTSELRMEVKSVDKSSVAIQQLVEQFGGFISNLNMANSNYELSNSIAIRVPSDKFQLLMDSIKQQAVFLNYERIHTDDVTEEYLDIQTRLKTKKEVRDRYIDILRNKAKNVKDVLMAEDKIRVIQEEIEAAEGRLKYLKNNVSLSTINVEIYQKIAYKPTPSTYNNSFFSRIGRAFVDGFSFFGELLVGLVTVWPILLILGVLFGFRKKIFRRFRKK